MTKIGEAAEAAMHIGVVGTPICITHRSYFELAQNCAFLVHPNVHPIQSNNNSAVTKHGLSISFFSLT